MAIAASSALPDIDDRLVEPETRYEMLDGELIYVAPADPPHAERHVQLCALLEAHTGPGFEVACDLLTRTSKVDDFAPDVSVYPAGPDPTTGRRQLEQVVFELVSAQAMSVPTRKAAKLAARGVRRIFAIDVTKARALEWSAVEGRWAPLDAAGEITDPALAVPLPIASLIRTLKADDDIARALVIKRNPVIEAIRADGVQEGVAGGLRRALVALLAARGTLTAVQRDRVLAERDVARLERWIDRAIAGASVAELLVEP
jgi:Uma2 family endonuclease